MGERERGYHMPVDLERHLGNLAESYPKVKELHSLWLLLRKRIEEELTHCSSIFVNYSLHDGSHSRTVIQAVERFWERNVFASCRQRIRLCCWHVSIPTTMACPRHLIKYMTFWEAPISKRF